MSTATDDVRVCCWSFAGPHGDHYKGEIVRADHPSVAAVPGAFVHPSTPHAERPTGFEELDRIRAEKDAERIAEEKRLFEEEARLNPIKIEGPELVKAKSDFYANLHGRPCTVKRGSIVASDHPLVEEHPEFWSVA